MYCLICDITPQSYEKAQAVLYAMDMLGCEEQQINGHIRLKCYFSSTFALHSAEFHLMGLNPCGPIHISSVLDQDWNEKWKKSIKPIEIFKNIWVSPSWLMPPKNQYKTWIKIEPKTAFGTGHHESTRLACKALINTIRQFNYKPNVLDIGTGTGILCFVADKIGVHKSIGIDIDPSCLSNITENKRKNPSSSSLSFIIGTIDSIKKDNFFDIIVMNMIYSEGYPLCKQISKLIRLNGTLIWSGILLEEKNQIITELNNINFILKKDFKENEWWCGVFQKENQ
jgi:ribosomal protein L11 methyltransferase